MLDQTESARSKRTKNPTSFEMVSDFKNSTRYRRRRETANILSYIHGDNEGTVLGAWDFVASVASKEIFDKLVGSYKRGKYFREFLEKGLRISTNLRSL